MKRIITFISILLLSSSLFAFEFSFDLLGYGSIETNKFSNPLPLNGDANFLNNILSSPYLDRTDVGGKLNLNFFFVSESRSGLSLSFSYGHPVRAIETIPVAESSSGFSGPWHYEDRDGLENQKGRLSIAAGGIFRVNYSYVEIGASIRGVVSSFDYFDTFTFGIEAEPFFKAYFKDFVYLSVGSSITAHIFRFINDDTRLYELNFSQISFTPYVGIGFRFSAVEEASE